MKRMCGVVVAGLVCAGSGWAQVSPALLISPWGSPAKRAETVDELVFCAQSETRNTGQDVDIWRWDSSGRVQVGGLTNAPGWVVGYKLNVISVRSDLRALDNELTDLALVTGGRVGEVAGDWEVGVLGGAGTANDGHFGNTDAIYGIGAVQGYRRVDGETAWVVGLWYDGNRRVLPDFPFPYGLYLRQVNPRWFVALGLPYSRTVWRPVDDLVVDVGLGLWLDGEARVTWRVGGCVALFGEYRSQVDGFWVDGRENRRLFFEQRRVAGGVKVGTRWGDISVGGGWAFDQDFDVGFDGRSPDGVAALRDRPFVMVRVEGKF